MVRKDVMMSDEEYIIQLQDELVTALRERDEALKNYEGCLRDYIKRGHELDQQQERIRGYIRERDEARRVATTLADDSLFGTDVRGKAQAATWEWER